MSDQPQAETDAIVQALVAERKRQGLSQREVARRSGISTGAMCEIERGDHSPMLSNVRAWAAALGYTLTLSSPPEQAASS